MYMENPAYFKEQAPKEEVWANWDAAIPLLIIIGVLVVGAAVWQFLRMRRLKKDGKTRVQGTWRRRPPPSSE